MADLTSQASESIRQYFGGFDVTDPAQAEQFLSQMQAEGASAEQMQMLRAQVQAVPQYLAQIGPAQERAAQLESQVPAPFAGQQAQTAPEQPTIGFEYLDEEPSTEVSTEDQIGFEYLDEAPGSALGTIVERAGRGAANFALGAPGAMADLAAMGIAGGQAAVAKALPEWFPGGSDAPFTDLYSAYRNYGMPAAIGAGDIPFGVEEIAATARAAPALFPGGRDVRTAFDEELAQITGRYVRQAQQQPIASAIGDMLGVGMGLAMTRMPGVRAISNLERIVTSRPDFYVRAGQAVGSLRDPIQRGFLRTHADKYLLSRPMQSLYRGMGRTLETGVDAAIIDLVNNDDPWETAGFAMGTQAASSVALSGLQGIFGGGGRPSALGIAGAGIKIGMASFALGSLLEAGAMVTPGGNNYILPAMESGFAKVGWGLLLGMASGAAGMGRLRNVDEAKLWPEVYDAINATMRGSTLSVIENMADAPRDRQAMFETMINGLQQDPMMFGESAARAIERAMFNEDVDMNETIDDLMDDDPEFRRGMEELQR